MMGGSIHNACDFMKLSEDSSDPSGGPDIIELDPNLNSAQTNNPSFNSLHRRWPRENFSPYLERVRSGDAAAFGSVLFGGGMGGKETSCGDAALSPDAAESSNRPTPNSSASSSERPNNNTGSKNPNAPGSSRSGVNSFEASPASSTNMNNSQGQQNQAQNDALRNMDTIFQDFSGNEFRTGLTPDQNFTMPDTPGKATGGDAAGENSGEFQWGMTPVSEGVLRTMLQLGPMETMDMGWVGPP